MEMNLRWSECRATAVDGIERILLSARELTRYGL
jgi:hypothetical protein